MALYDQFILFGDSLFQHSSSQERGFSLAASLQAEYIRRLDVVNRGFSGYNTDQALKILPKIIPTPQQAKVRFLIIFFGANDACLKIITHPLVQQQNPNIILVTPPPVNEYAAELNDLSKGFKDPRRKANHTKLYADAAREVAQQLDVVVLDLWSLLIKHAGWNEGEYPLVGSKELPPNTFMRMLLHDGLHFTYVAYTLYFQEIMRVISKVWPDQLPEKMPYVLPEWKDPKAWGEGGEYSLITQEVQSIRMNGK